jgi:signal transduction histidine kinase
MTSSLRVLLVEDEPAEAERLVRALRRAGVVPTWRRVRTAAAYLTALQAGADIILAAYRLRRFGAVKALDLLHQRGLDIPFIVVARAAGETGAIACLKRCASDYLRTDRLAKLAPAVARAMELKRLRDAKRQADAALQARTAQLAQALQALEAQAARLRALSAALAVAEQREQRRLAEALRDGLQQLLLAARLRMVEVEQEGSPRGREGASAVIELLGDAMEAARSVTAELGPPTLTTSGLFHALEWLARWMESAHHLRVVVHGDESVLANVDERTRVLLFQSVREILLNVVKHAHTPTARLDVSERDREMYIQVADAGVGFSPEALRASGPPAPGYGLFGVRQRLELLGGRLEIDSTPGRGSRVSLVVPRPLHEAAAKGRKRRRRILVVSAQTVAHQILVRVLRAEPGLTVVGEAADSAAALRLTRHLHPDVVIMDLALPDCVKATRRIRAEYPTTRVIGLALFKESDRAEAMREAGADDCLINCGPSEALVAALRAPANPGNPARN